MISTKICSKCNIEQPLQEFTRDRSKIDGLRIICRNCERLKRHTSEYRESVKIWKLNSLNEDPRKYKVKIMLESAKHRASIKGLDFSIDESHLGNWRNINHCPVFPLIELQWKNTKKNQDSSPSIDRIDNNLGYIPGNVRIISWRANRAKRDLTKIELQDLFYDSIKQI